MSTFFCALKDFVSQLKVPRNPTWWKLKGRMQDLRRQNLNFRNTIMLIIMDMTIIAHNGHHRNNHHNCHNRQILTKWVVGDQEFNGATARKTQILDNLGQEMRMQTLCREGEDGEDLEDLDRDGRQLGIGLELDLDEVQEEIQMRTLYREEDLEELQMPT